MSGIELLIAGPGEYLDEAGEIWAEATAARDGDPQVAPIEVARSVIERVVYRCAESLMLVAVDRDRVALGFAVCAQVGTTLERRAELRYLGVRPSAWGCGVGARLLGGLGDALRSRGFAEAELWVYCDNVRAVDLYRRTGWAESPEVRVHPRSGRLERRYTRSLAE